MFGLKSILSQVPALCVLMTLPNVIFSQPDLTSTELLSIELNSVVTAHNGTPGSPGSSSLTMTAPAVNMGDVLVAQITIAEDLRPRDVVCPPPGWTSLIRNDFEHKIVQQIFYYVASSTQPAISYTWHFKTNASACGSSGAVLSGKGATGGLLHYTGVDPVNPIDTFAGTVASGSGTTATAPSVTTTMDNTEVIRFFGAFKDLTFTTTDSRIYTLGSSNNSAERTAAAYHAKQATAGSTPEFNATLSSSAEWVSATVALRPRTTAMKLAFQVQPTNTIVGDVISPAIQVSVLDNNNNIVTEFNEIISIAIASNPGNGNLSGTLQKNAQNGIAVFDDLSIDTPGDGYTLQTTAGFLTPSTSNQFNIVDVATSIVIISGNNQQGLINTSLSDPFVIEVRNNQGDPVSDVPVIFTITETPQGAEGQSLSVSSGTTNSNGRISTFLTMGSKGGTYRVTASANDVPDVLFTAQVPFHTISGNISENGTSKANVTVEATGGHVQTVTTNSRGNYTLTNIPAGTGNITITPSRDGFGFIPAARNIEGPVTGDLTGINFEATSITYTITGTITFNGIGLEDVTVTASNGHSAVVQTNSNGGFAFSNVAHGATNIKIAPSKTGYGFTPGDRDIAGPVTSNITGIDFTAETVVYSISGVVTEAGAGLEDVRIQVSDGFTQTIFTQSNGSYLISGIPHGTANILITPSKSGYAFSPNSRVISGPVVNNISNVNFVTEPPPAPVLLTPADGSSDLNITIDLHWKTTERTDSYGIRVLNGASDILVDETGITDTNYTVSDLEYGTTYYWQVNAVNPSGSSSWSSEWSFTTGKLTTHHIPLQKGWNMISSYVDPLNKSMWDLFNDLIDNLSLVKDGDGNIFIPEFDINNIGMWHYTNGYLVFLSSHPDTLTLTGVALSPESAPVPLKSGWNLVSYLGHNSSNVSIELESIEDKLIIVKNGNGNVYIPAGVIGPDPINTIGSMVPGDGYQMYLNADAELIYPGGGTPSVKLARTTSQPTSVTNGTVQTASAYSSVRPTDNNAILIIEANGFQNGDEIGVWNGSGTLVGSGVIQNGNSVITVWGTNVTSNEEVAGAITGEPLRLTLWSNELRKESDLSIVSIYDVTAFTHIGNELTYLPDAVWLTEIEIADEIPVAFALFQNYPNPFNPLTTIQYAVSEEVRVVLDVYNVLGQKIRTLVDDEHTAGIYEIVFDGTKVSSGTYFYRIHAGDFVETKRFILLK